MRGNLKDWVRNLMAEAQNNGGPRFKRPKVEKYTCEKLRRIRREQTLLAIGGSTHFNGGMLIDKSKLVDLHM